MPLAAFVLFQAERGALRLADELPFGTADLLGHAPATRAAVGRGALSIAALCEAVVTVSDNTAANLLLRATGGPAALTRWLGLHGDGAFDLSSTEPALNLARPGAARDTVGPFALADAYDRLVLGATLGPSSRDRLRAWTVASNTGLRRIRAGLPTQ